MAKPHLARLRGDLDNAAIRSLIREEVRREVWALLEHLGFMTDPAPPSPTRKRPSLRLVKKNDDV